LRNLLDLSFDPDTPFQIQVEHVNDQGAVEVIESGPMVAIPKSRRAGVGQGRGTSFTLVDATLARLARPGQSYPTFQQVSSGALVTTLTGPAGVTVEGLQSWSVPLEEVKQAKAIDALRRVLAAAGQDFVVTPTGKIVAMSARSTFGPWPTQRVQTIEETYDSGQRVTGMRVERQSPIQDQVCWDFDTADFHTQALPNPLASINSIQDRSESGYCDQISLWNGDPARDGKLIDIRSSRPLGIITVPFNGTPPITHVGVNVYASGAQTMTGAAVRARLCVGGVPYESVITPGWEPGFSVFIGNQTWPSDTVWVDPMLPSAGFVSSRQADYLWQRGRAYRTINATFSHLVSGSVGQVFTGRIDGVDWPSAQVSSITWRRATTTVTGYVIV